MSEYQPSPSPPPSPSPSPSPPPAPIRRPARPIKIHGTRTRTDTIQRKSYGDLDRGRPSRQPDSYIPYEPPTGYRNASGAASRTASRKASPSFDNSSGSEQEPKRKAKRSKSNPTSRNVSRKPSAAQSRKTSAAPSPKPLVKKLILKVSASPSQGAATGGSSGSIESKVVSESSANCIPHRAPEYHFAPEQTAMTLADVGYNPTPTSIPQPTNFPRTYSATITAAAELGMSFLSPHFSASTLAIFRIRLMLDDDCLASYHRNVDDEFHGLMQLGVPRDRAVQDVDNAILYRIAEGRRVQEASAPSGQIAIVPQWTFGALPDLLPTYRVFDMMDKFRQFSWGLAVDLARQLARSIAMRILEASSGDDVIPSEEELQMWVGIQVDAAIYLCVIVQSLHGLCNWTQYPWEDELSDGPPSSVNAVEDLLESSFGGSVVSGMSSHSGFNTPFQTSLDGLSEHEMRELVAKLHHVSIGHANPTLSQFVPPSSDEPDVDDTAGGASHYGGSSDEDHGLSNSTSSLLRRVSGRSSIISRLSDMAQILDDQALAEPHRSSSPTSLPSAPPRRRSASLDSSGRSSRSRSRTPSSASTSSSRSSSAIRPSKQIDLEALNCSWYAAYPEAAAPQPHPTSSGGSWPPTTPTGQLLVNQVFGGSTYTPFNGGLLHSTTAGSSAGSLVAHSTIPATPLDLDEKEVDQWLSIPSDSE